MKYSQSHLGSCRHICKPGEALAGRRRGDGSCMHAGLMCACLPKQGCNTRTQHQTRFYPQNSRYLDGRNERYSPVTPRHAVPLLSWHLPQSWQLPPGLPHVNHSNANFFPLLRRTLEPSRCCEDFSLNTALLSKRHKSTKNGD